MLRKHVVLSLLGLLAGTSVLASTNPATQVDAAKLSASPAQTLPISAGMDRASTLGGKLSISWNDDLLHDLGLNRVGAQFGKVNQDRALRHFELGADSALAVDAVDLNVRGLAGGSGHLLATEEFMAGGKRIEWRNARMVVRPGEAPRIDLVSRDGETLFYVDRIMYEFLDQGRIFSIRSADLHVSALLAKKMQNADAADQAVAEFKLQAPVRNWVAAKAIRASGAPYWPGMAVTDQGPSTPAGATWQADVFMKVFSASYMRCGTCDANNLNCSAGGCDGPVNAGLGKVVFAPSSTLTNNRNRGNSLVTVNRMDGTPDPLGTSKAAYGADVPWYGKFTSAPNNANYNYPYQGHDQHPNLIWSLYRREVDGRITQIGRSGMKHAFLTTNSTASNPSDNCGTENGNHVLGRACQDTYGTGNNDATSDLGPTRELMPAFGIWGRCGSVFDSNCDGVEVAPSGSFSNRMLVDEADLPAVASGVSYLFESWYIVRDDIDIYNTMATRGVVPSWSGSSWSISNATQDSPDAYALGSAIDRWVPANSITPSAVNQELNVARSVIAGTTPGESIYEGGHAKVAVKVTDLGDGHWRYDYVVMNFDYARSATTGVESTHTLRVLRNHGFKSFSVQRDANATISNVEYADGDSVRADWALVDDGNRLTWSAPNDAASLDWGVMTRFSFVADAPPRSAQVTLDVTEPGVPPYGIRNFAVGAPGLLFEDGLE